MIVAAGVVAGLIFPKRKKAPDLARTQSGSGGGHATNTEFVGMRDPHPAPEPVIGPAKGRIRWAPPSPFQGEGKRCGAPRDKLQCDCPTAAREDHDPAMAVA
jgi:hypothetical protein